MEDLSKYYKEGFFYIEDDPKWAIDERGEDTHGKGDLISNTCYKIFMENDASDWAKASLWHCKKLLYSGLRWPYYMNSDIDAHSWLRQEWSNIWYNIRRDKNWKLNKFGRWTAKIGLSTLSKSFVHKKA